MNTEMVVSLGTEFSKHVFMLAGPLLLTGLVVGIAISMFQQVTSIREMTLTIVPKIASVFLVLIITMPWIINKLVTYTQNLFVNLNMYGR